MYGEELPPHSTDEYQFARGLLGIVGNMAGSPEGRQFLIENKNGKSLLRNLVLHLPKIPTPSGVPLKRLLMMIFWNMCVNKSVHCYLFELQIGQVIAHCLDEHNDDEQLQILGLELLLSITYNLTDPRRLDDIFKYVSTEHLRRIVETQRDKVGTLAQTVLDSLRNNNESIALRQNNQRWNE